MERVATPRRGAAQDSTSPWPSPIGGATGSVAVPSRIAAREGTGAPERPAGRPPIDGARGAIARVVAYLDNPWNWAAPGSRRNATPIGYRTTMYVRQSVPNIAGVMGFRTTGDARTPTTSNAPESATYGVLGGAVPFSRRRVVQTFQTLFDTRLQTVYTPREIIQKPQAARRVVAGPSAVRVMRRPWGVNLTVLPDTTTYGAATTVLNGPTGTTPAASPAPTVKVGRVASMFANPTVTAAG